MIQIRTDVGCPLLAHGEVLSLRAWHVAQGTKMSPQQPQDGASPAASKQRPHHVTALLDSALPWGTLLPGPGRTFAGRPWLPPPLALCGGCEWEQNVRLLAASFTPSARRAGTRAVHEEKLGL